MSTIICEGKKTNLEMASDVAAPKGGHEPAQAGLGASCISARANLARLGLARWSFGPRKWARPELAKNSV
jgi:hypothetical protein